MITTHYMDEAERCHHLGYISLGRLLAKGTAEEVVRRASLTTWAVQGPELMSLAEKLRKRPGVEQATAFGSMLHVCGNDAAALAGAIAPFRTDKYVWKEIPSGLEDVFIHLMRSSEKDSCS